MAAKYYRLKVPAFDLNWYEGADKHFYLLLPGGGGNTKSGVKNQVMIAKYRSNATTSSFTTSDDIVFNPSHLTDTDDVAGLCNGMHIGTIMDKEVACAMVREFCILLDINNKELTMKKIAHFAADFSKEDASLNACLVTSAGSIVSGGDDGVVRVWGVYKNEKEGENEVSWNANKVFELKDHKDAVSALCEHPTENWICSAGKDGACKLWDFTDGSLVSDIPCMVDGLSGIGSINGKPPKIECRGCVFSVDGQYLYTIQSPRKGGAYLIRWEVVKKGAEKKVSVVPSKVLLVGNVPLTRLAMSEDGKYLATGGSDGRVTLVDSETLKTVKSMDSHEMPITGLAFAPSALIEEQDQSTIFASCSVDNKIGIFRVSKGSPLLRILFIFIMLVVVVFMISLTMGIESKFLSKLAGK